MVTKQTQIISDSPFKVWNVRGYESGKLMIKVNSVTGISYFGAFVSFNDEAPELVNSSRAKAYHKGRLLTSNFPINEAGEYVIDIDLSNVNLIWLTQNKNYEGVAVFSTSFQPFILEEENLSENILRGGQYKELDVTHAAKQLDFVVNSTSDNSTYLRLQGSNDNFKTFSNINFIDTYNKKQSSNGYLDMRLYNNIVGFANIEGYRNVRLLLDAGECKVEYASHDVYVDRRHLPDMTGMSSDRWNVVRGYKAVKVSFLESSFVNDTSVRGNMQLFDEDGQKLPAFLYTSDFRIIDSYFNNNNGYAGLELFGKPNGEIIVASKVPFYRLTFTFVMYDTINEGSSDIHFETTYYNELPDILEMRKTACRNDYDIYELPSKSTNKDVYNNDVLEYNTSSLSFYMFGYYGIRYDIPFNTDNVPALKEGERIKYAYLLPFNLRSRSARVGSERYPSRIVVFTNFNRIFHNFPVRVGPSPRSDLSKFDESAIYNLKKKWLPVNEKGKSNSRYKYFPVLKDYDYGQFDGRVAGSTGFVDHYGNGGIDITSKFPHDFRIKGQSDFSSLAYSSMTKSQKFCAFGNYNSIEGAEPYVMLTNDGGRTWYIHAYFACTDYYVGMRGGNIDFSPISTIAPFTPNSLRLCRRRFNFPTKDNKEPATPYVILDEEKSLITAIEVIDGETVITLSDNVDYDGVFPVVYFENVSANSEWNYICNNNMTELGTNSNGIFFRVQKISANKYKLYDDLGNPYESDAFCRHIHAVNACSSGMLISTGESANPSAHEGGFIYFLKQNHRNGNSNINVEISLPLVRLCSASEGVNRACGAYMFTDESDPTIIYVSDEAFETVPKRYASIPGRTVTVNNVPAGVFSGKLSDIDEQNKFKCVCEHPSTVISLIQHMGHFAADGHAGSLLISRDGKNWNIETNISENKINGTDNNGNIYFGNSVIVFK